MRVEFTNTAISRSRSFKVTDFGTDRIHLCDFLLVISYHIQLTDSVGQIIAFALSRIVEEYFKNSWICVQMQLTSEI